MSPPLGLDAQAVYEASLRLALARREREHRPEHLALALVTLDPGAAWVLAPQASILRPCSPPWRRHSRRRTAIRCCELNGDSANECDTTTSYGVTSTRRGAPPPQALPSPHSSPADQSASRIPPRLDFVAGS